MIVVMGSIRGSASLLRVLLAGARSTIAGRIAGALRHLGRSRDADNILSSMSAAGYAVDEEDPFDDTGHTLLDERRAAAPAAMDRRGVRMQGIVRGRRSQGTSSFRIFTSIP